MQLKKWLLSAVFFYFLYRSYYLIFCDFVFKLQKIYSIPSFIFRSKPNLLKKQIII